MKIFERRYHASWVQYRGGFSPLSRLGTWMVQHHRPLQAAPLDLLSAASDDVAARLPSVAAREPTRRHQKHFAWLLRWQALLLGALAQRTS